MDINQKESLQKKISSVFTDDVIQSIIKQFSDSKVECIGVYTVPEFVATFKRVLEQLNTELNSTIWRILPYGLHERLEYGNFNLLDEMENLSNYFRNPVPNAHNLEMSLNRLIYYQLVHNFWDKSSVKYHDNDNLQTAQLKEKANALYLLLENKISEYDKRKSDYEKLNTDINAVLNKFNTKNKEVADLLNEAKTKVDNISEHLSNASNNENKIDELTKTQVEKLKEVTENISKYKKEYETLKKEIETLQGNTNTNLSETETRLNEAKKVHSFVEGKKDEIIRFTGLAADGMLGTKFDQRQSKLEGGIKFWRNAIPWMTVFSVAWVIVVFYCFNKDTNPFWVGLVINILKTTPAFILLGFVFKQYSKERNLEEEYAFKATVAMTLTAYSDMLQKADAEDNKTRQEMLLKSIQQVYTQPKIYSEKSSSLFGLKTKELNETIKNLSESVKNIKPE